MAREVVELAGDERIPRALKSKGKPRIIHAEENETVGCSEAAGLLIIEDEQNLSEDGMLYHERR